MRTDIGQIYRGKAALRINGEPEEMNVIDI